MKPATPKPNEQFRVLMIEDDMETARLLATALAALKLDCRHAPDGRLALEAFRATNPHLVLLDLKIPGASGHEVCAKIREDSTVPIIVLTALSGEDEQVQGFKLGADDYVLKPFSPKLLAARVMAGLRRAYRYDASENGLEQAVSSLGTSSVPSGWATCGRCDYMGPRARFEHENALGRMTLRCPSCSESDQIVFSLA